MSFTFEPRISRASKKPSLLLHTRAVPREPVGGEHLSRVAFLRLERINRPIAQVDERLARQVVGVVPFARTGQLETACLRGCARWERPSRELTCLSLDGASTVMF
jgi:hypothetical protein